MAIIITDQYRLRQKNFLDDRQGLASDVSALKSWNYSTVPIPEGFEVYVNGVWYIYNSSHTDDPVTGKFRSREEEHHINDHEARIRQLEKESIQLFYEDGCDTAQTFSQLLTASFWTDSTGENHAKAGRIVTVTADSTNNGPWYLISSDYTKAGNWIKLVSRGDFITTTGGGTSSDTNLYTAAKTDSLFPKKASTETISGSWTFSENQIFEKDITVREITAQKGHYTNLDSTNISSQGITNSGSIGTGSLTVNTNLVSSGSATLKEITKVGTRGSIKDEGGKTVARVDGLVAETSEIGNITAQNVTAENGHLTNLESSSINSQKIENSSSINTGSLTASTSLVSSGSSTLKEITKVGTNGSIKDEDGKTVARVDKIIAETSDLGDLDEKIRERMGLIGVSNILLNTSFSGEYDSINLTQDSEVSSGIDVYNSKYEHWAISNSEIVEDLDSITSHSMRLKSNISQISQETIVKLHEGTSYILSWKQKGDINVEVGNYTLDIQIISQTSTYKYCYAQIIPTTTSKEIVVFGRGPGNVFEIKLEEGVLPSSWFPSVIDTDPIADQLYKFEYLRAGLLDSPAGIDLTTTNLYLKNQIKMGDSVDDEVTDVLGGISGIVSDDDGNDVMIWSGSSFEKAVELLSLVSNNENYLDNLSYSQLSSLTKSIISFNYKSIFTNIYAVGKFKGEHLDENGDKIYSFTRVTGILPALGETSKKVEFTAGRLNKINGSYPTSINFGDGVVINFSDGLYRGLNGQITISTGDTIEGVTNLNLIFNNGYLVKVNSVKDYNTTYYWY